MEYDYAKRRCITREGKFFNRGLVQAVLQQVWDPQYMKNGTLDLKLGGRIKALVNEPIRAIKTIRKTLLDFFTGIFYDSYTWSNPTKPKLLKMISRTYRYRLASIGLFLTDNESRIKKLKNLHKGKRAFILGNGPSLNKCDLSLLKNEITFGVNGIYLNYENMGFYPTYYVVEDKLVAEDRADSINSFQGPDYKFFGNYLKAYGIEDDQDTLWLNVRFNYNEYSGFPHFSKNILRMVWVGGTVSYLCMQIAYYMGFDEIYLIGFDHDYKIPDHSQIIENSHILSRGDDPNHFHPDYFGNGYRWHDPQVERMGRAYSKALKYFSDDQRKIGNATIGGKLEIFDRANYYELFPDK